MSRHIEYVSVIGPDGLPTRLPVRSSWRFRALASVDTLRRAGRNELQYRPEASIYIPPGR